MNEKQTRNDPKILSTLDEIRELPDGAVVIGADGTAWQRMRTDYAPYELVWWAAHPESTFYTRDSRMLTEVPLTLLWPLNLPETKHEAKSQEPKRPTCPKCGGSRPIAMPETSIWPKMNWECLECDFIGDYSLWVGASKKQDPAADHTVMLVFEGETCLSMEWSCNAFPQSFCHVEWGCDCGEVRGCSTVDGTPTHTAWDDDLDDGVTHTGIFTKECSLGSLFQELRALQGEVAAEVDAGQDYNHLSFVISAARVPRG